MDVVDVGTGLDRRDYFEQCEDYRDDEVAYFDTLAFENELELEAELVLADFVEKEENQSL